MINDIEEINKSYLLSQVQKFKNEGYRFVTVSCVDMGAEFMIYYHFDKGAEMKHLKLVCSKEEEIPSISGIYLAGALAENEIQDLFGVRISGLALNYGGKFLITDDIEPAPFAKESKVKGEQ